MENMAVKTQFELEFIINSSPKLLYNYLTTPSAMSEWFADDVDFKEGIYTFHWDGSHEKAKVLSKVPGKSIKFRWLENDDDESFVEFRIEIDDLTKELAFIIDDFADEDEVDVAKMLWESQIDDLHSIIGV